MSKFKSDVLNGTRSRWARFSILASAVLATLLLVEHLFFRAVRDNFVTFLPPFMSGDQTTRLPSDAQSTMLNRFKAAAHSLRPPMPLPACDDGVFSHPHLAYKLQAKEHPQGAEVTISLICLFNDTSPRSSFRIFSLGLTLTALPPSSAVMRKGKQVLRQVMRLPDAGEHEIHARLVVFNHSDDVLNRTWPWNYVIEDERETSARWINTSIANSPVSLTTSATPIFNSSALPLCNSQRAQRASMAGRWVLGPRHEHITHPYPSTSIFDDYDPTWVPFDCKFDLNVSFLQAMRRVLWFHIVGDSNMRALFHASCYSVQGTIFAGDIRKRHMDLPRFCFFNSGQQVITYGNHFYGKKMPLFPNQTWAQQCAAYDDSLEGIAKLGTVIGWPNCSLAAPSIQQLKGPGLLYFGWGSHVAELGVADSWMVMRDELAPLSYFAQQPTIFALVENVDSSKIPLKFGRQFVYRNNERIQAVNELLLRMVEENWARWPIDVLDDKGITVPGFFPVLDFFSPSHAASEVVHTDAVHFWAPDFEFELIRALTSWIMHAPQLDPWYRVKHAR